MSRLFIPRIENAPPAAKPALDTVNEALGAVPNMFRLMALNPSVLDSYRSLSAGLATNFDLRTRELIAMAVAAMNGCQYCLSAHHFIGINLAKLTPEELALGRKGSALTPITAAIVSFAQKVAETRGSVGDSALRAVRNVGLSDSEILAVVALVAENMLTNMVNNVAQTDIDFPPIPISAGCVPASSTL